MQEGYFAKFFYGAIGAGALACLAASPVYAAPTYSVQPLPLPTGVQLQSPGGTMLVTDNNQLAARLKFGATILDYEAVILNPNGSLIRLAPEMRSAIYGVSSRNFAMGRIEQGTEKIPVVWNFSNPSGITMVELDQFLPPLSDNWHYAYMLPSGVVNDSGDVRVDYHIYHLNNQGQIDSTSTQSVLITSNGEATLLDRAVEHLKLNNLRESLVNQYDIQNGWSASKRASDGSLLPLPMPGGLFPAAGGAALALSNSGEAKGACLEESSQSPGNYLYRIVRWDQGGFPFVPASQEDGFHYFSFGNLTEDGSFVGAKCSTQTCTEYPGAATRDDFVFTGGQILGIEDLDLRNLPGNIDPEFIGVNTINNRGIIYAVHYNSPPLVLIPIHDCPDLTGDGGVSQDDLGVVFAFFGQSGAGVLGDVNGDGTVDQSDVGAVLARYGSACIELNPVGAPPGEPAVEGPSSPVVSTPVSKAKSEIKAKRKAMKKKKKARRQNRRR